MKFERKYINIIMIVLMFILLNVSMFHFFTKKCTIDYSEGMQAKSVELSTYLPFDENSKIVKVDSATKLKGDLPVLDGAAALYPVFSAFFHAVYPEDAFEFDGTDFTADSFLQMKNTRGAYQAVVDGEDDLIFCAKPSEEQLQYAKERGVELVLVPIGYEAFVFLVNGENPVDSLSVDEIKGIYSGEYTRWSQLGGEKKLINPLQRNVGSGSQTTFLSFMGKEEAKKPLISSLGSAIGFSFRYYVEGIVENGKVKMLAIDGVYPDKESIEDGKYPLTSSFYAVYRKDNDNPNVQLLINWILSDEGQKIVEESGYVRYMH